MFDLDFRPNDAFCYGDMSFNKKPAVYLESVVCEAELCLVVQ